MAQQPKQPQDHKTKSGTDDGEHFSFTHRGKVYTFANPTEEVLRPRFVRAHRWRTPMDFEFTSFETLAGSPDADTLEAIDAMTREEYQAVSMAFRLHCQALVGVTLGESSAS